VVAGTWVGRDLAWELPDRVAIDVDVDDPLAHPLLDPARLREVRAVMSRHVGVVRDSLSLASASGALGSIARAMTSPRTVGDAGERLVEPSRRSWESTNILTVASAVVAAAQARTESRGCHRRSDFPEPSPHWVRHLDVTLDPAGFLDVRHD
jgi:L-aspartate oxidase